MPFFVAMEVDKSTPLGRKGLLLPNRFSGKFLAITYGSQKIPPSNLFPTALFLSLSLYCYPRVKGLFNDSPSLQELCNYRRRPHRNHFASGFPFQSNHLNSCAMGVPDQGSCTPPPQTRNGGDSVCERALKGPVPVRDTPPYRAIPFRDSIAEGGVSHPFALFS